MGGGRGEAAVTRGGAWRGVPVGAELELEMLGPQVAFDCGSVGNDGTRSVMILMTAVRI